MKDVNKLFEEYNWAFDRDSVVSEIDKILQDNFEHNNTPEVWRRCLSFVDLTSLNSNDTESKIEIMMQKVNDFHKSFVDIDNVAAVCVYPSLVPITRRILRGNTRIAAVSACFPSSQTFIEAKIAEVALTVLAGADEIDIVISVGKYLSADYTTILEEVEEIKSATRSSHLKVIIESGLLPSLKDIKKASLLAIYGGADFIKTSTGKCEPAATLEAAWVMCQTIKEYYQKTGIKIGFKPAGGIATTEEAVKYYSIVKSVLGEEWLNKDLLRFGASRLANNLLSAVYGKDIAYY